MQLIILFFIFLSSPLLANCSLERIERSDQLYSQANQEPNILKQMVLLDASLKACYAPEIEASLLMIKAKRSDDVDEQIGYYKALLGVIEKFENREKALEIQNHCNGKLATLYDAIDQEVANIYRAKIQKKSETLKSEPSSTSKYIFYLIFSLLIFWGFLGVFKKN